MIYWSFLVQCICCDSH